METVDRN